MGNIYGEVLWDFFDLFFFFTLKLLPCRKTIKNSLLWGKRGGLSLTSVSVMFTVVVPDNPPIWPAISLAWITTWYCSLFSRSMLNKAVLMIPTDMKFRSGKEYIKNTLWSHLFMQTHRFPPTICIALCRCHRWHKNDYSYTKGGENHIGEKGAFKRTTYNTRICQILQLWRM